MKVEVVLKHFIAEGNLSFFNVPLGPVLSCFWLVLHFFAWYSAALCFSRDLAPATRSATLNFSCDAVSLVELFDLEECLEDELLVDHLLAKLLDLFSLLVSRTPLSLLLTLCLKVKTFPSISANQTSLLLSSFSSVIY